jgi:hypothetical protein
MLHYPGIFSLKTFVKMGTTGSKSAYKKLVAIQKLKIKWLMGI